MSWNKNTIVCSDLEFRIAKLKEMNIPYKLVNLGKVSGIGLNDYGESIGDSFRKEVKFVAEDDLFPSVKYKLYRLEYNDKVVLEQMNRHEDCDINDHLVCREFNASDVPNDWKLEVEASE